MKTTKEMIKVMQHFENGGKVKYYSRYYCKWKIVCGVPFWDWKNENYCIAEEDNDNISITPIVSFFCPECMNPIVKEFTFCPNCGEKINWKNL